MGRLLRNPGFWFWFVMGFLLILGAVTWVINALVLKPDAASWSGRILGISVWAGAFALSALLLKLLSYMPYFLRVLAAMWRPLVLVLAAAYLLFANDQGRELGISLMAENSALRLIFLFLALIYWAANNWHTARLDLDLAFPDIPKNVPGLKKWLFWPPRLLGVCAHLFAAINLSLAAANQPELAASGFWPVAWTAPLAIVLAAALVWIPDHFALSQRTDHNEETRIWIGAEVLVLVLLVVIVLVAFAVPGAPPGFSWGTISISGSAIVFLMAISWLRRAKPLGRNSDRDEREIHLFTAGLFFTAFGFACVTCKIPVEVGRFCGSMVLAYFAFGAILALVNAYEAAVVWASVLSATNKKRFVEWVTGRTRFVLVGERFVVSATDKKRILARVRRPAVAFLIGLAVINAWLYPFHRVRLCEDGACIAPPLPAGYTAATSPDERPSVAAAARAWYEQAQAAYGKAHGAGPVPMLIVAAAGGGIRAAYWTAEVLERIESDFAAEGGVHPYLFAISGVSGGSVGATAFDAALAQRAENRCEAGDATCPLATTFLTADFLAPALASLVFVDTPSSFLPYFGQDDRGTALERSFETASGGLLARPFLSLFLYKKDPAAKGQALWRPILLLNATHEETGKRIITGHVLIERDVFIDSLDALHVLGNDVRASTAAHNSARFTYISPAGDLGNDHGWVIDGGYFENYGALSALELARAAKLELKDKIRLVILMISSDPDLMQSHSLVRIKEVNDGPKCFPNVAGPEGTSPANASGSQKPMQSPNYLSIDKKLVENAWINELLAPFQGITNVRGAHGNRAAAELAVEICAQYLEPSKPGPQSSAVPPTGASESPPTSQSPLTKTAAVLANAKDVKVDESASVKASHEKPYFAHLAMCKEGQPAPVQPPLGWVLSKETQAAFGELLKQCGNDDELSQLEIALGRAGAAAGPGPVSSRTSQLNAE